MGPDGVPHRVPICPTPFSKYSVNIGSVLGPGPDTADSMINYHHERYSKEKHKKGPERELTKMAEIVVRGCHSEKLFLGLKPLT